MKNVLLYGSGARENALAWKLKQSQELGRLVVVHPPGAPPAWRGAELWPSTDFAGLATRARVEKIDLAVIGPDDPLAQGISNAFRAQGVAVFGPSQQAAKIEASKSFAKEIMRAAGVPTAEFRVGQGLVETQRLLRSLPWGPLGWVLKADGLALGKGVSVCATLAEALRESERLAEISSQILIEECIPGREVSWIALCDGNTARLLDPAQDYKRLLDGDLGPNTGGMGAVSPVVWSEPLRSRVQREVIEPVLREMKKRGIPFVGALYAGLMVSEDKFKVLEFNARFGDPETQVLMARFEGDLLPWLWACACGELDAMPQGPKFLANAAVYVVGAAAGYPTSVQKGAQVPGPWPVDLGAMSPEYFVAGLSAQTYVVSGGRVLGALGLAPQVEQARTLAYERLERVRFEGMQARGDIGR